jgi:exodeoxyribonuclease VII small subunit
MNTKEDFDKMSFEEAMSELESVVSKLDSGDGSLDDSILLFQKGVELSKLCSKRLDEIEKRVKILTDVKGEDKKEIDFQEMETTDAENA